MKLHVECECRIEIRGCQFPHSQKRCHDSGEDEDFGIAFSNSINNLDLRKAARNHFPRGFSKLKFDSVIDDIVETLLVFAFQRPLVKDLGRHNSHKRTISTTLSIGISGKRISPQRCASFESTN